MPSDYKKRIKARCSTSVQFENGSAIFKDDPQTKTTLTKPDTDSSPQCILRGRADKFCLHLNRK